MGPRPSPRNPSGGRELVGVSVVRQPKVKSVKLSVAIWRVSLEREAWREEGPWLMLKKQRETRQLGFGTCWQRGFEQRM